MPREGVLTLQQNAQRGLMRGSEGLAGGMHRSGRAMQHRMRLPYHIRHRRYPRRQEPPLLFLMRRQVEKKGQSRAPYPVSRRCGTE